jgi:uncharacterized protein YjbI with pentapeptide repeats
LLVPAVHPPPGAIAPLDRLRLENERVRLRNEARATLLQAFGGAFFLVTAFLTWRQTQVMREGQITERFTRAIEHLGTEDKLEVRLGGIYALERIAGDSGRDHGAIMEILAAYARRHAGRAGSGETSDTAGSLNALPPLRVRAPDLQAVMTVLGRRRAVGNNRGVLQLAEVDLRRAALPGADLRGVNLAAADLSATDLRRADLRDADLRGAELRNADVVGARLDGARLQDANLWASDLTGTNLEGANLERANLREARLVGGNLERAGLREANLAQAQLQEATLRGANLHGANLWGAGMAGVDLRDADLEGSTLVRASLADGVLDGASFVGTILEGANLTGASANRATVWPAGFDWRSAGVIMAAR